MNERIQTKLGFVAGLIILAISLSIFSGSGCKTTLDPAGVYQGDQMLYLAEKAVTTAYGTFHDYVSWELKYRALLPVEVSRSADFVRLNAKKWTDSASALRDAYVANPTKDTRDNLGSVLSLIDAALSEAAKYQTKYKAIAPK